MRHGQSPDPWDVRGQLQDALVVDVVDHRTCRRLRCVD
jgi:hypothetical protein